MVQRLRVACTMVPLCRLKVACSIVIESSWPSPTRSGKYLMCAALAPQVQQHDRHMLCRCAAVMAFPAAIAGTAVAAAGGARRPALLCSLHGKAAALAEHAQEALPACQGQAGRIVRRSLAGWGQGAASVRGAGTCRAQRACRGASGAPGGEMQGCSLCGGAPCASSTARHLLLRARYSGSARMSWPPACGSRRGTAAASPCGDDRGAQQRRQQRRAYEWLPAHGWPAGVPPSHGQPGSERQRRPSCWQPGRPRGTPPKHTCSRACVPGTMPA